MTGAEIKAYLEAHTRPRRFGPHFDALVEIVEEELAAQYAIREIDLSDEWRVTLAGMIADAVDWHFRLERRDPPGEG